MINFRIGCSGYHYPEWKGIFYPLDLPKGKWFEFYCEHFNTIELNGTFYKFPRVEFLRRWYDRSPMDFTFAVKAPRVITHFKKLQDSRKYLNDFYNNVSQGLKEKLGCLLFQFPVQFEYTEERLYRILEMLDPGFKNVVEFRHASWWNEEVFNACRNGHVIFSGMSHPTLPDPVVYCGSTVYHRFHGVPHLYLSSYSSADLESVVNQMTMQPSLREVYIIFNNTMEGAALQNARDCKVMSELVYK